MKSLLGNFYSRIRGAQEDIASESLVYILNQSLESRNVIHRWIKKVTSLNLTDLYYQTQTVGENNERPDISGMDESGKEVLLIEAKFWAALTQNQPNAYLKRLGKNTVLLFLVPSLRTRIIFDEVKFRISENEQKLDTDNESLTIRIPDTNQFVIVKSWHELLISIKSSVEPTQNIPLLSDINQIIGLCDEIDNNAFQPIRDIDLAPDIPKRINSYYDVIDKVVDELKARNVGFSTKGLLKTPQRYGYHRFFGTHDWGLNLALKLDLWEKYADTPFWFSVSKQEGKRWVSSPEINERLKSIAIQLTTKTASPSRSSSVFIALTPTLYETEDVLIRKLADQIEEILKSLTV